MVKIELLSAGSITWQYGQDGVQFSREKLTMDERSAMEESFFDIVKINIPPDPYDLLRKLFDEKIYEATRI